MAGVSGSIIPSPSAPTHPLLESTWANQPTAMIEVVEDTEEVVAAATDEMIVATEEEMRAGDITQGGPHLPITVAVEVDAGGTTDPVPDRIPHVLIKISQDHLEFAKFIFQARTLKLESDRPLLPS